MARPKNLLPKLCIDKSRGRAFCKVDGRFVILGPAGSAEARLAYGKLLVDLKRRNAAAAVEAAKQRRSVPAPVVLLNDIFLKFVTERLSHYGRDEQFCIKGAIKAARELFGDKPAAEFGPLKLRLVRDAMIKRGWSRSFINKQVKRLRLVLRWAVSWELISQTVVDSLSTVTSLTLGECAAPESRPRHAIPDADLQVVRGVLPELHRDLFDLMLLTGSRPGELVGLTGDMIDQSGEVWRAELVTHKTGHQGKCRVLYFNRKSQT